MSSDFDTFFTTHYDTMVRSLTAVSGDAALAADCTQEAFIRAYARWRRISRYDAPAAWVRKVALNRLRDEIRSRDRRRSREERASHGQVATTAEPVLDETHRLLAALPVRQRTALALHYIDDMPVRDIARVMGISEGAVKFHLSKGRERLGAELTERAEESS